MNVKRRSFMKLLGGATAAGAAIAALPTLAKNPELPKGLSALPEKPVIGEFRILVCAEDGKWRIMNPHNAPGKPLPYGKEKETILDELGKPSKITWVADEYKEP